MPEKVKVKGEVKGKDTNRGIAPPKEEIERMMREGLTVQEMAARLNIGEAKTGYWKRKYGFTSEVGEVNEWIEEHPEIKRVYATLRESSRPIYYSNIRQFCLWAKKEPNELWEEPWEVARDRIIDFRIHLEEEGMSANTISVYSATVRRFYEYRNIVFKGKFITNGKRAMPKKENEKEVIVPAKLRELLEIAEPMERTMYMCQYQSGLSANELCNLQVKDVGKLEKDGSVSLNITDGVIMLKLTREKTGVRFITFLGHDAIEYLKKWLELRQSGKMMRDREIAEKAIIRSNTDYLFVVYTKRTKSWDKIDPVTYARHLLNAVRTLGWIGDDNLRIKGRLNVFRPHALRMTFSERLKHGAELPWDIVEVFLGHKFSSTDSAYVRYTTNDLMKYYKQGEPFISLTPIEAIVSDDKYKDLKTENALLREEIAYLKDAIEEIRRVRQPELTIVEKAILGFLKSEEGKRFLGERLKEMVEEEEKRKVEK
jgi:integrase